MSVLPIVTYDDEVLRKKAEPVEQNSDELQKLINDMFDTMYNSDGVGLAAPQVGKLVRIFVADADPMIDENSDEVAHGGIAMINPEFTFKSEETNQKDEGCLSIPGVNAGVTRPESIVITYLNQNFERQELEVGGSLARVIQHEADHLDGILFLDHLSLFKQKMLGSQLSEIADGDKEIAYPVVPKTVTIK